MKIIKLYVDGRIGEAIVNGHGGSFCSYECPFISNEHVTTPPVMLDASCRLDTFHVFPKYATVRGMNRTTRCKKAEIDAEEYQANENARRHP